MSVGTLKNIRILLIGGPLQGQDRILRQIAALPAIVKVPALMPITCPAVAGLGSATSLPATSYVYCEYKQSLTHPTHYVFKED